jgi:hypothetical protein
MHKREKPYLTKNLTSTQPLPVCDIVVGQLLFGRTAIRVKVKLERVSNRRDNVLH